MNKRIIVILLIGIIINLFIDLYFASTICASDNQPSCTPTLPIPSNEYLLNVYPSIDEVSTPSATLKPILQPIIEILQSTPTAGQSAVPINIEPTSAPMTGKGK